MKLGRILAEPRTVAGIVKDPQACLAVLAARLGSSHALAQALQRSSEAGQTPRDLEVAPGVRLLDVGSLRAEAGGGEPGLLLGLSDSPDPVVEHAAWIVWGLSVPSVNLFLAPALRRLSSGLPKRRTRQDMDELLSSREFAESRVKKRVVVEDAVTPLSYRVYSDTPVAEVQHLMLRRALSAVPVVGGRREVLGVITAADLLPHVLPRREDEPAGAAHLVARDVMNRSVLCVAADEGLAEAGRSIVERGVAQLPVVRDGEMIGFLGRAAVMRAFAEAVAAKSPE